jgi:hypothetical protein
LKTKIFSFASENTLAYYNAGVVVGNLEVLGLVPGATDSTYNAFLEYNIFFLL